MILSNKLIIKALIRLRESAGSSAPLVFLTTQRQAFPRQGSYKGSALENLGPINHQAYTFNRL